MPGPYTFTVYRNAQGFDFNGQHYNPGDTSPQLNACQMKSFISSFQSANPNGGIDGATEQAMAALETECPATHSNAVPVPATVTPPVDANPATSGGDSPTQQGAPNPPVSGTVVGTPNTGDSINPNPAPSEEPRTPPDGEPVKVAGAALKL